MNNDYKSVTKYLEKNRKKTNYNIVGFIKKLFSKVLVCICLIIVGLIVLKYDKNNEIYNFLKSIKINGHILNANETFDVDANGNVKAISPGRAEFRKQKAPHPGT